MLKKIKKLDMLSVFLESRNGLPVFQSLFNSIIKKKIDIEKTGCKSNTSVYCVYDFPGYLVPQYDVDQWVVKTVNSFEGSIIKLKNYKDETEYLKTNFSNSRRSKFNTYRKRLEKVFNISYKAYCGDISEIEYNALFSKFHELIEKRFVEKQIKNDDLARWDVYIKIALPLIRKKQAVLFVIYDEEAPISICLNLIRDNVIYGYIRAYDIDYSKYYLGFTDFIKQLEWCYANNIKVFDLLKGKYEYKSRLIDDNYFFQKHIIYSKNSSWAKCTGTILYLKINIFYKAIRILKKLKIDDLLRKILEYRNKKNTPSKVLNYSIENITDRDKVSPHNEIDISDAYYSFLKRPVYDTLYKSQESLNSIKVFNDSSNNKLYYILSNKILTKITIN